MVVYIVINEYDDIIEDVYLSEEKAKSFVAKETERYDGFYKYRIVSFEVK